MSIESEVQDAAVGRARSAHYSAAVEAGGLLFISGQLALDEQSRIAGADIVTQTRKSLENLDNVLAGNGLDRTDVVKVTIWLTRASDFAGFNETYACFFGDHKPSRSTVVSGLVLPDALIELEAVARTRG